MRGTGRRFWRTRLSGRGEGGRLRDKLWVEGYQATLLRGWLTQADQQRGELMTDWNTGLVDAMPRLKEKAKKMVRERVVLRREREELQGDNKRLFGELQRSKAAEAPAAATRHNLKTRLAMADADRAVA
jgi:hypothetical protein